MFQRLFRKKSNCTEADIANLGLNLAMAFGKNWHVQIQSRLSKEYPELTQNELNGYNLLCQTAMKSAHEIVDALVKKYGEDANINEFETIYVEEYPWVTTKNVKGLFSQGMYYAHKGINPNKY